MIFDAYLHPRNIPIHLFVYQLLYHVPAPLPGLGGVSISMGESTDVFTLRLPALEDIPFVEVLFNLMHEIML